MERGDVYLVSLDPTREHERQGRRPVLVISPAAFNRVTGTPVVLPITSGGRAGGAEGFAISLDGLACRTTGIVRCDQPRALDFDARAARKVETLPAEVVAAVMARLATLYT